MDLRRRALELLRLPDPAAKAAGTRALLDAVEPIDTAARLDEPSMLPGRPPHPLLVAPSQLPHRSPYTRDGRAALLHAVAHIEFNAINLALDAVWRFAGMPEAYLPRLAARGGRRSAPLQPAGRTPATLGHAYGDFDAHDGLWTMVEKTRHDIVARMALVPRTLEARGLDAAPPMQAKLARPVMRARWRSST